SSRSVNRIARASSNAVLWCPERARSLACCRREAGRPHAASSSAVVAIEIVRLTTQCGTTGSYSPQRGNREGGCRAVGASAPVLRDPVVVRLAQSVSPEDRAVRDGRPCVGGGRRSGERAQHGEVAGVQD